MLKIKDFDYMVSEDGKILSIKSNKILKQTINKYGYCKVSLYKNKKSKTFSVHRLVAQTFISIIKPKMTVNHMDGNKLNNNVKNLEIISSSENQLHAYKNNLRKENKNMKPIIRNDDLIFKNAYEASEYLNVSVCSIRDVLKGRTKTCKGYTFKYW